MTTKDEVLRTVEALKMALEALEDYVEEYGPHEKDSGAAYAITAIRVALASKSEALAHAPEVREQDTVLPGGGHVPAVPVAVYGYCPECGGAGVMRERRPNGDDKCTTGHKYPSSKALAHAPTEREQPRGEATLAPSGEQQSAERGEPMAIGWQRRDGTLHRGCPPIGEDDGWTPLYTTPPRREWVGLTDEQINEFFEGMEPNNGFWLSFGRAIEAKLKEKNGF